MPILNLQRSFAEVGRIRLGEQVATGRGGTRPAKLGTFRLTSPDKIRIDAAAELYGGTPAEWQAPAGKQWEVITEAETIPVLVPPVADMTFTQWFELWSGGGCLRRCDTETVTFTNDKGAMQEGPCLCDADARECKPHSRLSILLPELPGLGVWRLDTQGFYAARELGYSVENIIALYDKRGDLLPANLRLDQRMIKRPGKQTVRFVVPVLDVAESPNELLRRKRALPQAERAIETAPLTPVPDDGEPTPSIAEQTAAVENIEPRRRKTTKPVAATGVQPRTAEQARQTTQQEPAEPSTPTPAADTPPPEPPIEPDIVDAEEVPMDECQICARGDDVCPHHGPSDDTPNTQQAPPDDPEQLDMLATEPESESESVALISEHQLKELSTLIRDAALPDKQSRRNLVVQIIGRDVATVGNLTEIEADKVISTFENDQLITARYKLDLLLRGAGFDDEESQREFITAAIEREAGLKDLTTEDEITTVTAILESDAK